MPTLQEILRDPNYVNANPATKQAIFERWAPQDPNYATANEATQAAIRQRFGIGGVSAPVAAAPMPAPKEESGFFRQALDIPVGLARGFVQGTRMVADAFGAGSDTSNTIRGVEDFLGGLMSAQAKNDQQEIARIMQEAEDKGAGAQVRAALQAFMTAPVDLISQGLGTAGPVILAGLGAKVLGGGAAVAKGVGLGLGAGMGAGTIKGTIYEETKRALTEAGMPEEQAEARAQLAQSYGGENLDMILAGTALGGLASTTGIEKALTGPLARNILARAGAKEAAVEAAEQGAERMATQGLARRVGTGAVTEAAPEFLQGSQEQLAANLALQREGFDVDTMRGVIGAGTLEGLVGAGLGAGIGAIPTGAARPAPETETEQETQTEEETATTEEIPPTGPQETLADILTPPPPPTPEEVRAKELQELQTQIGMLDQQIQDGESRGTTLTKQEKSELQKLRNNRKKLVKKIDELSAAEVAPPATPIDTTPPAETLGDVPDLSVSSVPGQAGTLPDAGTAPSGLSTTTAGQATAIKTEAQIRALTDDELANLEISHSMGFEDPAEWPLVVSELARRKAATSAPQGTQTTGAPSATQVTPTPTGQKPSAAGAASTVTGRQEPTKTKRDTKLDKDEGFLDGILGDPSGLPSRGAAEVTPEQAKVEEKLNALGADYGLQRREGEGIQAFATRLKQVMADRRAAEQEFAGRLEQGEPTAAMESELIGRQSLVGKKPMQIAPEQRGMYEEMREEYNQTVEEDGQTLPAFDKLTPDEKAIYFTENIARNTYFEHQRAARRLSEYLGSKREESEAATRMATKEGATEQETRQRTAEARDLVRAKESYQRERDAFSRKSGIAYQLPVWGDLSEESQRAYAAINKTDTVIEQDMAFRAVKRQVQKEATEQRSREGLEQAERRATQEMETAAERARAEQPAGKGEILPTDVIQMLGRGDIQGVLKYLNEKGSGLRSKLGADLTRVKGKKGEPVTKRTRVKVRDSVAQKVFRALAGALANVEGLKVNVVFDPNMVYDQIARYDANTNTLYVGPNGLDEATILHELVHAATVKLIHQYFTDPSKLDARQRAAVEQIQNIASYAKRVLGNRYPNAFENLYEFVAYAMTDMKFQNALAQIQVPGLAKATAKTPEQQRQLAEAGAEGELERGLGLVTEPTALFENLWDAFTGTIAWVYKLFRPEQKQTKILLPTEKTRLVGKKEAGDKKIAPVKDREQRELTPEEQEALTPEKLFDDPEAEADEAVIPPLPDELVTERGVTNLQRAIMREPGYKGNLLLEAAAAVQDILAAPEGGIERLAGKEGLGSELFATQAPVPPAPPAPKQRKTAVDQDNSLEAIRGRNELPELSTASSVRRRWTGRKAYNTVRTKFQNSRDVIKRLENAATLAGKTIFAGPKINAVYSSIIRASGIAKDLFLTRVEPAAHNLRMAISSYAEITGLTVEEAARDLHLIAMAKHEPERRAVKYMLNVPLSTTSVAITLPDGSTVNVAPSEFRKNVLNAIYSGKLNKTQVTALRGALDNVIEQHKNPSGFSEAGYKSTEMNSEDYNVVGGYSPDTMKMILNELETDKTRPAIDKAMKALQVLHKETKALDKESNYWSAPVQSVVDFYGWQNYVPLKGKRKDNQYNIGKNDDLLNFDSPRLGKDFQELQGAFEGRETDSDNSIIQSMVDATRAAMRAGRKDVTLAIKNAVKDKLLFGAVVAENVPFADREAVLYEKYRGPNFVYHYNPDGTVDVIQLSDSAQREAIKRTYEESQPLIDSLNYVTSKIGQFHTRYNLSFAPMNFIRDALAHAYTLGAEFGPKYTAQYLGSIAARVANGGMFKAAKVARLYENGQFKAIEAMAKKDPYVAAMYEYIQEGGKVSYLQGISTKSQQQELQRDLSSSNLRKAGDAINKVFDIWIDTFELSARTAAYEITKSQALAEGLSDAEARAKATSYTKELANFETVGEWGKAAGAMFMFFRPAATGAVRAIDSVGPAFRSFESAKNELPSSLRDNPEALAEFKKNYEKRQKSARIMSLGLLGLGAMVYMMAYTMSDDDDYGRNKVGSDDMARWQRFARFYIPGTEDALKGNALQIPWGFGLGAFASAGAQLASLGFGNNSISDVLINSAMVGMDSFLPLPVSRINPLDKPAAWLMDSALPSAMRPFLEWTMNVDGLGREIYNNRPNRFGDAYTGGDNIPEAYKAAARMLYDATDGAVDWSPNTLYFFANNYFSGPSRLATGAADIGLVTSGEKAFNPKTDTIFFSSFFGTPSNVDAREFADAEKKILDIQKRLKTLEAYSPEKYAKYVEENPTHQFIVDSYNTKINQTLRDMRQEANVYRRMQDLSPKERNEVVKSLVDVQNLLKRDILNMMDALGLEY
jgi:hypothetical protein